MNPIVLEHSDEKSDLIIKHDGNEKVSDMGIEKDGIVKRVVDSKFRSSKIIENVTIQKHQLKNVKKIKQVYGKYEVSDDWSMLIYKKGDKFNSHSDKKHQNNHVATVLLFPPIDFEIDKDYTNSFVGGDLIFHGDGYTINVTPSQFKAWTYVIFPIELEHECTPIIKGKRIVFKSILLSVKEKKEKDEKIKIKNLSKNCSKKKIIKKFIKRSDGARD